ncbi:YidB family protein [Caenimonas aquaedulcis]|uniref:DUF937 domain-containing protein n=1 Tax=Caenimonas aquaedulcis TaxID=2793270 RepID=A0A931H186_9BURK|nr:YidB family protein [Caenimonas aquaedulcis]MBG9386670.1 DUF937 domain-containing protein [Caenimonas aquaedulcis]
MSSDFLSQILGSVLGRGAGAQGMPGGLGGLGGGGLGGVLGSVLGGGRGQQDDRGIQRGGFGGKGAIIAMLLPLAMQWVQRNGGLGAVLQKFRQKGYSQQASSWVSTGDNEPLDAQAVTDVMGSNELSQLARQLGVSEDEVAGGMAQIMPQVVDHLTPSGEVPQDADDVLGAGLASIDQMFGRRG